MKKFKIVLLVAFLVIWIIVGTFCFAVLDFVTGGPGLIMPDENKADKLLAERYETLLPVAEIMFDIDGYYIRWDTFDENLAKELSMLKKDENGHTINVEESVDIYALDEYTDIIRKYKIWHIVKEDNFVSFSLWSSFSSSCSLVYCEEGIPKIEHDGENYVAPLSAENWYYHTHVSDR